MLSLFGHGVLPLCLLVSVASAAQFVIMDRQTAPFKLLCPPAFVADDRGCCEETGALFLFGQCREPLVVGVGGIHEQFLTVQDRTIAPIRVATHASCFPAEIYGQGGGEGRMCLLSEARVMEKGNSMPLR